MQPQWEANETVSTEKQAHCLLICVTKVVWTSGDMNVRGHGRIAHSEDLNIGKDASLAIVS